MGEDAKEEFTLDRTNGKRAVGRLCLVWRHRWSGRAGKHASIVVLSQLLRGVKGVELLSFDKEELRGREPFYKMHESMAVRASP